jgi:hypothetical protein
MIKKILLLISALSLGMLALKAFKELDTLFDDFKEIYDTDDAENFQDEF